MRHKRKKNNNSNTITTTITTIEIVDEKSRARSSKTRTRHCVMNISQWLSELAASRWQAGRVEGVAGRGRGKSETLVENEMT